MLIFEVEKTMLQFSEILSILTNKMTYNNEDLAVGQIADEKKCV